MNRLLIGSAGAAAGAGLAGAATAAYVTRAVQGRATGDLQGFLDSNVTPDNPVVVFAGASIVKGRASVDFVDLLRPEFVNLLLINAGENGDTVDDLAARIDSVVEARPTAVIILVGTNDAQQILTPTSNLAKKHEAEYGSKPTVGRYQRALAGVCENLLAAGVTHVGLCTLPPLGQDLSSPANEVIRELNGAIRSVSSTLPSCELIDVYEELSAALIDAGAADSKAFTGKWQPGAKSLFEHFIVGRSYDQIATRNGLLLSPDLIHLNSAGAQLVARACEAFLRGLVQEPSTVVEPQPEGV